MLNQVLAVRQDSLLEFGTVEVDKPEVILIEDVLLDPVSYTHLTLPTN